MSLLKFIRSKSFLKQLLFAGIIVILLVFLLMKWLNSSTNHDQRIQVPDLSKLTKEEAVVILNELDLQMEVLDSSSYNANYPPLTIIEHNPEANGFVKEKRTIYLKINRATFVDVKIPDVLGETRRNAEVTLRVVGFKIGEEPVYISDIARDVVRGVLFNGKKMELGKKLPQNSVINLVLGDGKGLAK
ncbi:MAG: PASTA domain-containing protein [Flavobacteriaceae bacterium]|nr:PASTA domain-containing protein [Flavobacteriaceae bacterium]